MTGIAPVVTLSPRDYDDVLFDLDGVLTRTASVRAAASKRLFEAFLEQRAADIGGPFVPFDLEADYRARSAPGISQLFDAPVDGTDVTWPGAHPRGGGRRREPGASPINLLPLVGGHSLRTSATHPCENRQCDSIYGVFQTYTACAQLEAPTPLGVRGHGGLRPAVVRPERRAERTGVVPRVPVMMPKLRTDAEVQGQPRRVAEGFAGREECRMAEVPGGDENMRTVKRFVGDHECPWVVEAVRMHASPEAEVEAHPAEGPGGPDQRQEKPAEGYGP